jgi:CubicO group peptidase (beta-lactamase class C family)
MRRLDTCVKRRPNGVQGGPMRATIPFFLCAVLGAPAVPATPPTDAALSAKVGLYLQPYVDLEVFSGVVLVARGERVLAASAFGKANLELDVANSLDQRFRIASLSKPFTTVAIGTLIDAGKLELQTPLSRFLPQYPQADRITIELLLTHRAGVPNVNSLPYDEEAFAPNDLPALVAGIEKLPPDFAPGARKQYSNGGYALLAAIIERVSGESYTSYLRRAVLAPLGLADTGHEDDGAVLARRAYGYMPSASQRHGMVVAPFQQMNTKTGGGSLYSTAGDLHRFSLALLRHPLLRPATWQALFQPREGALLFTGRCPGFNSAMRRDLADDLVVVVLSNNYASGMLAEVAEGLTRLARGQAPEAVRLRGDVSVPAARLRPLIGRYEPPPGALPLPPGTLVEVALEGQDLVVRAGATPVDVLVPQSERAFLARNLWSELTFAADGNSMLFRPLYRPGEVSLRKLPAGQ